MRQLLLWSALVVLGAGCDKTSNDTPAPAPANASASAQPAKAQTSAAASAKPSATVGEGAKAKPKVAIPEGRSKPPTSEEWNKVGEVTVKGSSALSCETKMVREWLRVSCKGKNDSGGTPVGIQISKGKRADTYTMTTTDTVSLVMPFVEGTNFEAQFAWTDKSHPLTVSWPKGNNKPVIIGVFEGAKSPLDGTAFSDEKKLVDRLCACHKKLTKSPSCDDLIGGPSADCDRTYKGDCEKLLMCSRGEPGVMPDCVPPEVNGPFNGCYQPCKTVEDCKVRGEDTRCEFNVCFG